MLSELRPAVVSLAIFTVILGGAYPLAMTGAAQALFPDQANGSLVTEGDRVIGSSLIAQPFEAPRYFAPRPSAVDYNGVGNGGSNLGPTSAALVERVATDVARLAADGSPVPIDLVTTSGSGLDPHLSPAAARFQAEQVAAARGLAVDTVLALVDGHVEDRTFGVLGEPRVNVLALNLALDAADLPAMRQ